MSWLQFSVELNGIETDAVSEFFHVAGALSVTSTDAGDEPLLEPAPGETPLWQRVRVTALMSADTDAEQVREAFTAAFPGTSGTLTVETLEDRDWSNTWRDDFGAMCFGKRLWIVPSGEQVPAADAVVIHLDPGLAFGTGTHATTAMCLEWLDAHPPVGQTVIDYGCGSGILAIAACKLGAAQVSAVDIDPQALQATRDNAARNGIADGLTVQQPQGLASDPVDLVLANILANPLIELADTLTGRLRRSGWLVMTGILAEQADDVMAAYRDAVEFTEPCSRDEWVLLAGRKR